MTQVLNTKKQEILNLDLTDPKFTDEELLDLLMTQGESKKHALRRIKWERHGIQRPSTITTTVDGEEIVFLTD
jgi:hypothetical protein